MIPKLLLPTLLTLATTASAQTLWTVGPGAGQFPTIGAAVAAASAGDRIEVLPGAYPGFTVDKGVAITGRDAVVVAISPPNTGGIVVQDVPAGERAVISGIRLDGRFASVTVRNNAGRVLLDRLVQPTGETLVITDSPGTSVDNCRIGHSATVRGSRGVTIRASVFFPAEPTTFAREGLTIENSDVELTATRVEAGSFYFGANAGILLRNGNLRLRGPSNVVRVLQTRGGPGNAILASGSATLELDPGTELRSFAGAPPVAGVTPSFRQRPSLHASTQPLPGAVNVTLFDGRPGANYAMFVSLPSGPTAVPGLDTSTWLDLPGAVLATSGVLGADGRATATLPLASNEALVATAFTWQALVFGAGATAELTNPASYVHYR